MNGFVPVVWFSQYAPYHKMPEGAIPAEWMPVMTEDTQRAQVPPWQRTLAIGAGAQPIGAREGRSPNEVGFVTEAPRSAFRDRVFAFGIEALFI